MNCHECKSYNQGVGSKSCLQCPKYHDIRKKSVKRKTIQIEILPANILELFPDEEQNKITTILGAIQSLPPQLAAVTVMIHIARLSLSQTASLLHISKQSCYRKNKFSLEIIKKSIS